MSNICLDCVSDIHIKKLINANNTVGECTYCLAQNVNAMSVASNEFLTMVAALIRWNFHEGDYNTHFGGDGVSGLFHNNDIFFNKNNFSSTDLYEEFIDDVMSGAEDSGIISLYAGHDDSGFRYLQSSLRKSMNSRLENIFEALDTENFFSRHDEMIEIIVRFSSVSRVTYNNLQCFRARIGFDEWAQNWNGVWDSPSEIFQPYTHKAISAPPPLAVSQGRANREHVSFFYGASTMDTAIAEVRPNSAQIISIGEFVAEGVLSLFDLTLDKVDENFINFYQDNNQLDNFQILHNISNVFSNPVVPESKVIDYARTQLVVDAIRESGFDGFIFDSSISDGINYVLFDSSKMKYVENSGKVTKINNISYDIACLTLCKTYLL